MTEHSEENQILRYVSRDLPAADRQEVFFHLLVCDACRTRTVELASTQQVLNLSTTWELLPNDIEEAIAKVLKASPSVWWEMIRSSPSLCTPLTVRALLAEADRVFSDRPTRNLQICAIAARFADQLAIESSLPLAGLRFDAWKDLSTAHRVVGDIAEATTAIEVAERLARNCDEPEHCAAQCDFARAIILTTAEKYSEASVANVKARAVFQQTDFRRFVQTFWQEAIILAQCGRLDHAAATFESLIGEVAARGNKRDLSDLYGNIAGVFAEMGKPWIACDYLARSIEIDKITESRTSELRNTWTMGVVLRSTGRTDEAIEALHKAGAGYRELGMGLEVVLIDLDVALARIARGDNDLHEQMKNLAVKTAALNLPVSAATAVHELKEIAARRSIVAELIEYTIDYLNDAAIDDELGSPFRPPSSALFS